MPRKKTIRPMRPADPNRPPACRFVCLLRDGMWQVARVKRIVERIGDAIWAIDVPGIGVLNVERRIMFGEAEDAARLAQALNLKSK